MYFAWGGGNLDPLIPLYIHAWVNLPLINDLSKMEHFPNYMHVDRKNRKLQMRKQTCTKQTTLNWSYNFMYIMVKGTIEIFMKRSKNKLEKMFSLGIVNLHKHALPC